MSSRYIGSYEIVERVVLEAYPLALPPCLAVIHDVFHVSMLKRYISSPSHILQEQPIELKENLSYEEKPIAILAKIKKYSEIKSFLWLRFHGETTLKKKLHGNEKRILDNNIHNCYHLI